MPSVLLTIYSLQGHDITWFPLSPPLIPSLSPSLPLFLPSIHFLSLSPSFFSPTLSLSLLPPPSLPPLSLSQGESHSPHLLHVVDQSLQLSTRNIHRLMKALVPTSWGDLEELFYNGYKDAYRFFKLEGVCVCVCVCVCVGVCVSVCGNVVKGMLIAFQHAMNMTTV